MAIRRIRQDTTGSAFVANTSSYTGQAATNGTITNSSQGAVAVANAADLNSLRTVVNSVLDALRVHGMMNTS